MTLEDLQNVPLQYTFGSRGDTFSCRQYQNEVVGICKMVCTPYDPKTHKWGTPEILYMNLKTRHEFTTAEDLLADLNPGSNNT